MTADTIGWIGEPCSGGSRITRVVLHMGLAGMLVFGASIARASTIAWWQFEEGLVDTAAPSTPGFVEDSGPNDLDGTAVGGPIYRVATFRGGALGLEFDGVGERIVFADSAALAISASLTLEAVINLDGYQPSPLNFNQIVFRGDDRSGADPYFMGINNLGRLVMVVTSSSNGASSGTTTLISLSSPSAVPTGQFVHVAGSLDVATDVMRLYIDGAEVASGAVPSEFTPFPTLAFANPGLGIGSLHNPTSDQFFDGIIGAVRISDAPLQPSQFLPVPELGSLALLGASAAALIGRRTFTQLRLSCVRGE